MAGTGGAASEPLLSDRRRRRGDRRSRGDRRAGLLRSDAAGDW